MKISLSELIRGIENGTVEPGEYVFGPLMIQVVANGKIVLSQGERSSTWIYEPPTRSSPASAPG